VDLRGQSGLLVYWRNTEEVGKMLFKVVHTRKRERFGQQAVDFVPRGRGRGEERTLMEPEGRMDTTVGTLYRTGTDIL
jgi:hypothetical protein